MDNMTSFLSEILAQNLIELKLYRMLDAQEIGDCSVRSLKNLIPAALCINFLDSVREPSGFENAMRATLHPIMLGTAFLTRKAFRLPKDAHTVWFLENLCTKGSFQFMSCYCGAVEYFDHYFRVYQSELYNRIVDTQNNAPKHEPQADPKLLLACYQKFQSRVVSSAAPHLEPEQPLFRRFM